MLFYVHVTGTIIIYMDEHTPTLYDDVIIKIIGDLITFLSKYGENRTHLVVRNFRLDIQFQLGAVHNVHYCRGGGDVWPSVTRHV